MTEVARHCADCGNVIDGACISVGTGIDAKDGGFLIESWCVDCVENGLHTGRCYQLEEE